MQLNPSEISELIKDRIKNFEGAAEARTEGTVVSLMDGIARIHGLADVMSGEMIEFPGNTYGMALNLERDELLGLVLICTFCLRFGVVVLLLAHSVPPASRLVVKAGHEW